MGPFFGPRVGLTWPTEVQKVQKLIRHHIEGKLSLHLKFCKIGPVGSSFGLDSGQFLEFLAKTKSKLVEDPSVASDLLIFVS